MDAKTKILFLASNPEDKVHVNLDEEIHLITSKIRASEHRDGLDLISRWAVRPDDLLQELNTLKPTIVHFSGHGSGQGELVLMNDLRQSKPVSPSALTELFSTVKDNIRLVVLNACYSRVQAEAIAEVIDYVIGMNKPIGDNAAIVFAASFYRALGFGRSVKDAFDQGKVSLMLEGIPEENTPVLFIRKGMGASSLDQALITHGESAQSALVDRICGYWWGKVALKEHESDLACIRVRKIPETGLAALDGRSFAVNGELVAVWRSLFSDVKHNAHRNHIEFNYLYHGQRHDRPAMTLLFGKADVEFEVPADPRKAIQRGEGTFVSVYKSADATDESWGTATQRRQMWARAKSAADCETLQTAVTREQRKPIVERTLSSVWKLQ